MDIRRQMTDDREILNAECGMQLPAIRGLHPGGKAERLSMVLLQYSRLACDELSRFEAAPTR
jgi:hypothetical protein